VLDAKPRFIPAISNIGSSLMIAIASNLQPFIAYRLMVYHQICVYVLCVCVCVRMCCVTACVFICMLEEGRKGKGRGVGAYMCMSGE